MESSTKSTTKTLAVSFQPAMSLRKVALIIVVKSMRKSFSSFMDSVRTLSVSLPGHLHQARPPFPYVSYPGVISRRKVDLISALKLMGSNL
jgi:hypothetical protein